MPDDRDLTRRLTATLTAYAEAAPVATGDAPFDSTRRMADPPLDLGTLAANGPGPRRPTRLLLLAAAVLALVGTAVLVVPRQGDGEKEGDDLTTERHALPGPPTAPDDALGATWAPDGWDLTEITWSPPPGEDQNDGVYAAWPEPGRRAQLFTDPERPALRVLVESGGEIAAQPETAGVEVRGEPAMEESSELSPPTAEGLEVETVWWSEAGTNLRATFAVPHRSEALAFLDGLEPRSGAPLGGFDTPSGSTLTLTDEATASADPPTWTSTVHSFTGSQDEEYGLRVDAVSPSGSVTTDYVISRLYAGPTGDGTVTVWDEAESTLVVARPDGTVLRAQVYRLFLGMTAGVTEVPGLGAARPVVDDVLASVEPVTSHVLQGSWHDIDDARAAKPLVARVELPTAEIEVRREGEHVYLCQVADDDRACVDAGPGMGDMYEEDMTIGGREVSVAVNRGGAVTFEATYEGGSGTPTPIEAEVAHDGDWWVSLVPHDDEIEDLGWGYPGPSVADDPGAGTATEGG